jgi:hypothetical protein
MMDTAQQIVTQVAQGDFAAVEQRLAGHIKPFLSVDALQASWQGIEQQVGAFQEQGKTSVVQTPQSLVQIGHGEWILLATVSIPQGDGPFAAVLLVHGSGPQDRDETLPPNKPFRDLAWGLASQGIAVLCYDKRTKVYAASLKRERDTLTVKEEVIS